MKTIISIVLTLFICNYLYAQNFDNYQPLKSSGSIPADFTDRTSEKAANNIKDNLDSKDSNEKQASTKKFLLKSNYYLDDLLMSGRVLFGDPVSEYVNKVADKLLENEPELRKELRFYCLKSNVTNAFSTNQGMIFVTLGLISQLENEAQLAQVLAHEITHYTRKHVINTFLETSRVNKNSGNYQKSSSDENIIKLSNYSKTLEFEADSLGYFRLRDAGYRVKEALSVFDILQFSYLPFEEEAFEYDFFETETVKIPSSYKLDSVMPIHFIDDYDDKKSTHPNVKKRRIKIEELIGNEKGGKRYLQTKELFKKVRTICRFESVRLNNKNAAFVKAIYNSQLLLKKYPNNDFLNRNILKSLYGLSKYKLRHKYYKIADDYEDHEGEISAAYYFFENLTEEQLFSITLEKLNEYYLNHKEDKYIKSLIKDLIYNIAGDGTFEFNEYYKLKRANDSVVTTEEENTEEEETESKYAKLRALKKEQEKSGKLVSSTNLSEEFYREYLYNVPNKEEVIKWFKEAKKKYGDDNIDPFKDMAYYEKKVKKKKALKNEKKAKKKNIYSYYGIQADKIVFIDPEFMIVNNKNGQKLTDAEVRKYQLYKQIETLSKNVNMEQEVLTPKLFESSEVDKYNDLATLNDWAMEKMLHLSIDDKWNIITTESEYIPFLSDKYKTATFLYMGVYQENKESYLYFFWFDVVKDEHTLLQSIYMGNKAKYNYINSQLYNVLKKVKN